MIKDTTLIFGANGMLGSRLVPYLNRAGFNVITVGRSTACQTVLNQLDKMSISKVFEETQPEFIINLIAATNVDKCERDIGVAFKANTLVPSIISECIQTAKNPPYLVHMSTDQVYEGFGNNIENIVNPINVYGLSKLAGELMIHEHQGSILRTNFFGRSYVSNRQSFSDWLYLALIHKQQITLFDDIIFSGLHIRTLCQMIHLAMQKKILGVYNVGTRDSISKAQYAQLFSDLLKIPLFAHIASINESSNLVAKRPLNMSLNVGKFENKLGIKCPTMQDEIIQTVKDYINE